jgi:hypothetical protein
MRIQFSRTLLAALLAGFSACGGGGSSGGGGDGPITDNRVPITDSNAQTVTTTVIESVVAVIDFGTILDATPIAASSPVMSTLRALKPRLGAASYAPVGPETMPCAVSGTITISGNIADPFTLSTGDTIEADFADCNDGDGVVIDGLFSARVEHFEGDLDLIQARVELAIEATDLSVSGDGDTVTADGDFTFVVDTLSAPLVSLEISGRSLTVSAAGQTVTLQNFSEEQTQNETAVPRPVTFEARGRLSSSSIGGPVDYSTPVRFEAFDDAFPYTGEFLIVGADESSVRLVALNETNVRLDVDEDGNGSAERTIDLLWDEVWAQ